MEEAKLTLKKHSKASLHAELVAARAEIERLKTPPKPDTLVIPDINWLELSNTLSRRVNDLSDDLGGYECHEACKEGIMLLVLMAGLSEMRVMGFERVLIQFTDIPPKR